MNPNKLNVAIITNIIPTYREGFYDRLFRREDLNVTIFCQDHIPGMNLVSIHKKYGDKINIINFISAPKGKITWQFLPWVKIFNNFDVVFVGGNPRVLSDLSISIFLNVLGRCIVHWTMAHSFRANSVTENIRLFWSRMFKYIFVYTDAEVNFLRNKGFNKNFIIGMNNGLDQKSIDSAIIKWTETRLKEWRISNKLENKLIVLSCARLESKNKFDLVVSALPLIIAKIPNLVWCIIGNGDEKNNLENKVKTNGLEENVRFVGEMYKEDEIAPWFLSSEILIHPAAIGLTLLHSFGYGLPVVTHGEANLHNPEYAAFVPELTGRNFKMGDINNLSETVIGLLNDKSARTIMKNYAFELARNKYNVDVMVERFVEIAKIALNETRKL